MSSWFSTVSTLELDNKISEATSESIPNGEVELSVALEITDLIRSKKIPPQQCMRSLKKRLTLVYSNPNLLTSTLKLIDLCVKNSGYHFLIEISSKEFIDYLVDFIFKIHYNIHENTIQNNSSKLAVGEFILQLIQEWKIAFENQLQLNYVEKVYNSLKNQNYQFPSVDQSDFKPNSKFIDSEVPPDWIDSDSCMICYNAFSIINRKHHCRSCGGVFCNDHSLSRIPLVSLGIMEPVRVCDNCFAKHTKNKRDNIPTSNSISNTSNKNSFPTDEDEDEELKKAIELSLKETSIYSSPPVQNTQPTRPQPSSSDPTDEDEEMKAAIAESLKAFEEQQNFQNQYQKQQETQSPLQPSQPESDFYNIAIPSFQPSENDSYDQSQQPSHNYWEQQSRPQQPLPSQQNQPPQKPPVEDLTQQEEENINLFITLMTTLKSDPKKRSDILYDENLNNLHAKVVTLKPKMNKSLRIAIEKYEAFLELNNKISTVIKLYDEFLESKLNLAYRNHNISSPNQVNQSGNSNYFRANEVSSNPTFIDSQTNNQVHNRDSYYGSNDYPVQQQQSPYQQQPFSQQSTGQTQSIRCNSQYQQNSSQQNRRASIYDESNKAPMTTFNTQQNEYSDPQSYDEPEPTYNKQSNPEYLDDNSDPQDDSDKEYLNNISQSHQQQVHRQSQQQENRQSGSYPLHNYNNEQSNYEISNSEPKYSTVRRQSSSIPNYALEEATAKFPALEDEIGVETHQGYSNAATNDFSSMDKFPKIPTGELEPTRTGGSSTKSKFIPEPEPLIEL